MTVLVAFSRTLDYAARAHAGQRRKGAVGEPYVNHCIEVAHLLAEATAGADLVLLQGGLLHDTVEDTAVTQADLAAAFGAEVAELVGEVSDDIALSKHERRRLQVETAPFRSVRARQIKLADKISNMRAILSTPPVGWGIERRIDYYRWAADVARGCRGVNPMLEAEFDRQFVHGLAQLETVGG